MIIEIFEPSLCCSSGVCGPEPDKELIELQNTIQVLSKAMVEVKALVPYLTAVENVMIALNVKNNDTKKNRNRAIDLLEWVGLDDRTTHYPKELSAGQQQRVAIARALANDPDLLLADEPTGNLDPALSEEIMNILNEINQNQKTTIVMVTHSPAAANYGTVKIHLHEGRLKEQTVQEKELIA